MESDFELLDAWRGGDTSAGNRLFDRHYDGLLGFFRNKAGDEAEDLVQQTLLACVRNKDGFEKRASFRTYLYRAAKSKLYDHWRRRSSRPEADFGVTSLVDLGMTPSRALSGVDEVQALMDALRQLPLDQQVALELFYFQDLRGPQLAETLEISEGTVRSRLRLGKSALRKLLADNPPAFARLEGYIGDPSTLS